MNDLFSFCCCCLQADRRDVLMHEPLYNNLVRKATAFLESSGPDPKKDEISAKLDDVKKRWDELKRKTNERHAQIEDVLPLAQKYHDNSQNVKDVVTLAETELGSYLGVSPDVEIAKQELQNIKVCYRGVQRRRVVSTNDYLK